MFVVDSSFRVTTQSWGHIRNDDEGYDIMWDAMHNMVLNMERVKLLGEIPIIVLYRNYDTDETGAFDYNIGIIDQIRKPLNLRANVVSYIIEKGTKYKIYNVDVQDPQEMTQAVRNTWTQIWEESHVGVIDRTFTQDLEIYTTPLHMEIYVAVK